jgi:hypothetical protein
MAGIVEFVLRLKDEASPALKKTTEESEELVGAQKDVTTATNISGAALLGYATAAIGAATAMAALVKSSVDATNALLDASTRTGVAADTLQGLKLAAEGSGLSFQSVEGIMAGFTNRLASAAGGSKEAAEAFERLGVATKNELTGGMRDADDILKETITKIQAIPSATDQAAAATLAFGRQGTKLLQALSGKELSQFVDIANKFGIDVGPRAAKAAGDWQRASSMLGLAVDGLKDALVASSGGIQVMLDGMKFAGEATVGLAAFMPFLVESLGTLTVPFKTASALMMGFAKAWKELLAGNPAAAFEASAAGLADAMVAVGDTLKTALTTPERLAKTAAAAKVSVHSFRLEWDNLFHVIEDGTDKSKDGFKKIEEDAEGATKAVEKLGDSLFETFEKMASSGNLFDPIIDALRTLETMMIAKFNKIGIAAGQILGGQISGVLEMAVKGAGEAIGGAIGGAAGAGIGGAIGGAIAKALGGLATLGDQGADAIVDKITGSIDSIGKGIEEIPMFILGIFERWPATMLRLAGSILKMLPELLATVLVKMPVHFANGLHVWWSNVWQSIRDWFASLFSKGRVSPAEVERRGGTVPTSPTGGPAGFSNSGPYGNNAPVLGSRDTGGLIPQTGLYMLHQGETVVRGANQAPSSGSVAAAGRAAGAGVSGSTVIVNVSSPVADSNFAEFMGRELERIFGAGGLRTSTVMG